MNLVILEGHIGKTPELKEFPSGNKLVAFSLATSKNVKSKDGEWESKTTWHNIVAWNGKAEHVVKNFDKGSFITVQGEIQSRSYDNKDGVKVFVTEINAGSISSSPKERIPKEETGTQPSKSSEENALGFLDE